MKKILSITLAVIMLVSVLAIGVSAAEYTDTKGHWGETAINVWSDREIVGGIGNNLFDPDGNMTRAQAAVVFKNLLKLQKTSDVSKFTDMEAGAWYTEAIAACLHRGIMFGTGTDKMSPNAPLTREQMFVMFARAMGIEEQGTSTKVYSDEGEIASWAAGYINALSNKGFISGVSETDMAPKRIINRASVMTLLNNAIGTYVTEPGDVTINEDSITLVVTDGVTMSGNPENLAVAAPEKTEEDQTERPVLTLKSADVAKSLTVLTNTEIRIEEGSKVANISVRPSGAGAVVTAAQGTTTENVEINADDVTVQGEGEVKAVEVGADNATINTAKTEVATSADAEGTKVNGTDVAANSTMTDSSDPTTVKDNTQTSGGDDQQQGQQGSSGYTPAKKYKMTLTITDDAEPTTNSVSNDNTAGTGSSGNAKVLDDALTLVGAKAGDLQEKFGGQGTGTEYQTILNGATNRTQAVWDEFMGKTEQVSGDNDKLVGLFTNSMEVTYSQLGTGTWTIAYSADSGHTYTVTITIS